MDDGIQIALLAMSFIATLLWLMQLVSVVRLSDRYFESHTHRLTWFLVVFVTFLIGVIWFQLWKDRAIQLRAEEIK